MVVRKGYKGVAGYTICWYIFEILKFGSDRSKYICQLQGILSCVAANTVCRSVFTGTTSCRCLTLNALLNGKRQLWQGRELTTLVSMNLLGGVCTNLLATASINGPNARRKTFSTPAGVYLSSNTSLCEPCFYMKIYTYQKTSLFIHIPIYIYIFFISIYLCP